MTAQQYSDAMVAHCATWPGIYLGPLLDSKRDWSTRMAQAVIAASKPEVK